MRLSAIPTEIRACNLLVLAVRIMVHDPFQQLPICSRWSTNVGRVKLICVVASTNNIDISVIPEISGLPKSAIWTPTIALHWRVIRVLYRGSFPRSVQMQRAQCAISRSEQSMPMVPHTIAACVASRPPPRDFVW